MGGHRDSPVGQTTALQSREAERVIEPPPPLQLIILCEPFSSSVPITVPSKQNVEHLLDCVLAKLKIPISFRPLLSLCFSGHQLPLASCLDMHGLCEVLANTVTVLAEPLLPVGLSIGPRRCTRCEASDGRAGTGR